MPKTEPTPAQRAAVERAHKAHLAHAAERACSDPIAIQRAARIVRAAIARDLLTVDDVAPIETAANKS